MDVILFVQIVDYFFYSVFVQCLECQVLQFFFIGCFSKYIYYNYDDSYQNEQQDIVVQLVYFYNLGKVGVGQVGFEWQYYQFDYIQYKF